MVLEKKKKCVFLLSNNCQCERNREITFWVFRPVLKLCYLQICIRKWLWRKLVVAELYNHINTRLASTFQHHTLWFHYDTVCNYIATYYFFSARSQYRNDHAHRVDQGCAMNDVAVCEILLLLCQWRDAFPVEVILHEKGVHNPSKT